MNQTLILKLQGMHCTSCAANIDLTLEELPGVITSNTSYAANQTRVTFDPDQISLNQIQTTIKELGYSSSSSD